MPLRCGVKIFSLSLISTSGELVVINPTRDSPRRVPTKSHSTSSEDELMMENPKEKQHH